MESEYRRLAAIELLLGNISSAVHEWGDDYTGGNGTLQEASRINGSQASSMGGDGNTATLVGWQREEELDDMNLFHTRWHKYSSEANAVSIAVKVIFPIVGVLMLKCMEKAQNVRETIELSVPVCGINSLCIVCMILLQGPACIAQHFASAVHDEGMVVPDHASAGNQVRYHPILAVLLLPFPLVCSIVCIVAAGRNRRFMVRVHFFLFVFPAFQMTWNDVHTWKHTIGCGGLHLSCLRIENV